MKYQQIRKIISLRSAPPSATLGATPMPILRLAMLRLLAGLAALAPSAPASAWGHEGHRIVAEIAWAELTPDAKHAVRALLPPGRYGTLHEAATWADRDARRNPHYAWLAKLHYVRTDPDDRSVDAPDDCVCVLAAITRFDREAGDPDAPLQRRIEALRLVAHFVGDVHQPLHVGGPDGHGGTRVEVRFDGRPHDLHWVWDTGLIRRQLAGGDWRRWAQQLAASITDEERARWTRDLAPRAWADESLALARRHTDQTRDGERLPKRYLGDKIPVVALRLKQAGVRLAALLNRRFGEGT